MYKVSNNKSNLAVVHLVWLPYGIQLLKNFIAAYVNFNPGCSHSLIIIFNGVKDKKDVGPYNVYLEEHKIRYQAIYLESGQDIDCYFYAADKITNENIIFLNSFSVFLNNNWLEKYIYCFEQPNIGLISATASNQSYYSSVFQKNKIKWEIAKGFGNNFRKYKLFAKAFFYWRFLFKPFPNAHVRTNAFMIKRELFLKLKCKPLTSKFKAYQFESGRNSMTSQILKMGYKVLVIDKDGKTYGPKEWKLSKTFWCGEQEGLLVSDNQTRMYDNATAEEKKIMTKLAWG